MTDSDPSHIVPSTAHEVYLDASGHGALTQSERVSSLETRLSEHLKQEEAFQQNILKFMASIETNVDSLTATQQLVRGILRGAFYTGVVVAALFTDIGHRILHVIHKLAEATIGN